MTHAEKTTKSVENRSSGQPLKIDSPDSTHEKEAKSVGEQVARKGQIMGSENSMNGQITGNPNPKNGMIAPAGLQEQLASTKGGGDKLPDHLKSMMKGNPGELDDVRIHTDSRAAELSEAVNAKAFTHGKDIYFGQGFYNTLTAEGKELLVHELAHASANQNQSPQIIQRAEKVSTAWGTFEEGWQIEGIDTSYGEKYPVYGFGGVLNYTPKDPTDATSIGLVQIARGHEDDVKNGDKILYDDKTRQSHAVKSEDSEFSTVLNANEEGFHVDREGSGVNPLYAVTSANPGETLSQGKTEIPVKEKGKGKDAYWEGAGQHGWHYIDNGQTKSQVANIFDVPNFSITKGNKGGIVLETAAVALEGNQKGRYYGSVTWGWDVAADGTFTKNHIKLASMGAVTPTFMKAAHMWNAGTTSKGKATTDLPTQDFYKLKANGDFYPGAEFSTANKAPIETPSRFEKISTDKIPTDPNMIYVRVVDGTLSGGTGWINTNSIELEDNTPQSLKSSK